MTVAGLREVAIGVKDDMIVAIGSVQSDGPIWRRRSSAVPLQSALWSRCTDRRDRPGSWADCHYAKCRGLRTHWCYDPQAVALL